MNAAWGTMKLPHSPNSFKNKSLLETHSGGDLHQCFLIWDLLGVTGWNAKLLIIHNTSYQMKSGVKLNKEKCVLLVILHGCYWNYNSIFNKETLTFFHKLQKPFKSYTYDEIIKLCIDLESYGHIKWTLLKENQGFLIKKTTDFLIKIFV